MDAVVDATYDTVLPRLHSEGFIPNDVTIVSALARAYAFLCLHWNHPWLFAVAWVFGYYLDCIDGALARRFDQVTDLGEKLDHGTDIVTYVGLLLYLTYRHGKRRIYWAALAAVFIVELVAAQKFLHTEMYEHDAKTMFFFAPLAIMDPVPFVDQAFAAVFVACVVGALEVSAARS